MVSPSMRRFLLLTLMLFSGSVFAEGSDGAPTPVQDQDQPELPAPVKNGEPMEPDVH